MIDKINDCFEILVPDSRRGYCFIPGVPDSRPGISTNSEPK